MIETPEELLYNQHHLWVAVDNEQSGLGRFGITTHMQEELPEILSIDLPMVGDELELDTDCIQLHLPEEIVGLPAPLTGRVVAVNRDVLDNPDLLHVAPYEHWIIQMEFDDHAEFELLTTAAKYGKYCETL